MADGQIDIKEDAAPTKELATQTHLHGATTVHAEEVVIVDSAGNLVGVTAGALKVDGSAVTQPVSDGGGALTVDALDLDIRNLVPALDEVKVSGTAADGVAVSGNPIRIGGKDGGGLTQDILTDASGNLQVNVLDTTDTAVDPALKSQLPAALVTGRLDVNLGAAPATVTVQDANLDNATLVDNAAFADGTTRVAMSGYVFDEVAGTALTENDAAAARVDSKRAQVLVLEDATTRGQRQGVLASGAAKVDITSIAGTAPTTVGKLDVKGADGDVFVRQATAANLNAQVVGEVAHDSVDSGNPQKMGAQARQTNPTAVADADRTNLIADDVGRQVVRLGHVRDLITDNNVTISDANENTILAAGAAGVFHDLTTLIIANTSATGVRVDIRDATAGTIRMSLYCPATQTVGFTLTRPKNQTTAANNWTAQASSAVTDLRVYVQAEKNV